MHASQPRTDPRSILASQIVPSSLPGVIYTHACTYAHIPRTVLSLPPQPTRPDFCERSLKWLISPTKKPQGILPAAPVCTFRQLCSIALHFCSSNSQTTKPFLHSLPEPLGDLEGHEDNECPLQRVLIQSMSDQGETTDKSFP